MLLEWRLQTLNVLLFIIGTTAKSVLRISTHDISLPVLKSETVQFIFEGTDVVKVALKAEHDGLVHVTPNEISFDGINLNQSVTLTGLSPGHVLILAETNDTQLNIDNGYIRVTILNSKSWDTTSIIIGWIYFVAWSVSFYPQIFENWKRKSVVGLNFDYIALNITGFVLYSLFNAGVYWNPAIRDTYFSRHPGGVNPVLLNDIVFSFHAVFATVITIGQCFFYERGDQSISWVARGLLIVYGIIIIVTVILSGVGVIEWLDFLYYCSYIKLSITLFKYIPQAYMNYKRKSTIGWSIGNVLLDFTGGILSMLQMIINSWNFDDWNSIFGDPTKFGLGLFSVIFDIFFIIQHYILYGRNSQRYYDITDSAGSSRSTIPQ